MPPVIATASLPQAAIERIRSAFLAVEGESTLASAREALLLDRFVVPDSSAYRVQRERAEEVERSCPVWP
jgi:ABC-type phosphate/phosphonate transport system substrate-binding protein